MLSAETRANTLTVELDQSQQLNQQSSHELSNVRAQLAETVSKRSVQLTEAESQYRVQLTETESKHRAQLTEIETQHTTQLAEVESQHSAQLMKTESQYETELMEKDSKYSAQLSETESKHRAQLAEIESQHRAQLIEIETQYRAQLTESDSKHSAQLAETESRHSAQLTELESKHSAQLLEIESQHRAQLVEIESLALEKEQEKLNATLMATQETTAALEVEIVTLKGALSAATTSNTNLTSEMNELTQRHEDVIQRMTVEIQSLQTDLDDVRTAKQRVLEEHTSVHNDLLALQTKYDAAIVELQEAQQREILAAEQYAKIGENAKLQNEAIGSKLQAALDQSRADLDQAKADLVGAKTDLDQSRSDLVQVKADLVQVKTDLDQAKADFSTMVTKNSSLEGELKVVRTEIVALETQAKEHLHQLELARVQYMEDKDTIAQSEREKQSLLNDLEKARSQALKNQTQATEDHAAAVAVRVENAVLVTKNDALSTDLTRMKEQSDHLSMRVDTLQKERDELKALVSSTEGNFNVQLAILTTRNEGLSIST